MQMDPVIEKKVQERAKMLTDKYIREGSERQVNIGSDMAAEVIKEVDDGKAHAGTFVETEKEIITLLSRDKLGTFKVSEEFKGLMVEVGGYQVDTKTKLKGGRKRGGSRIDLHLEKSDVDEKEAPKDDDKSHKK